MPLVDLIGCDAVADATHTTDSAIGHRKAPTVTTTTTTDAKKERKKFNNDD